MPGFTHPFVHAYFRTHVAGQSIDLDEARALQRDEWAARALRLGRRDCRGFPDLSSTGGG